MVSFICYTSSFFFGLADCDMSAGTQNALGDKLEVVRVTSSQMVCSQLFTISITLYLFLKIQVRWKQAPQNVMVYRKPNAPSIDQPTFDIIEFILVALLFLFILHCH